MNESSVVEIGMVHSETSSPFRLDIATAEGFDRLFDFQKDGARFAERLLSQAFTADMLDRSDFKRVVDFGAGYGGPTFTLSKIATMYEGTVTAVEKGPLSTKVLQSGVIPDTNVIVDDGLSYLDSQATAENRISLITAFMFGPDKSASLFKKFMTSGMNALGEDGKLFVNSDKETMTSITDLCTLETIPFTVVNRETSGEATTIIIHKNDCKDLTTP